MPSLSQWRKHLYGPRPDLQLRAAEDLFKYKIALDLEDLIFILDNFASLGLGAAVERALLERAGPQLAPYMIQRLYSPDRYIREPACTILGKCGDFAATPYLLNTLRDPLMMIRRAAALALGSLGDRSAVPALRKAVAAHARDINIVRDAINYALSDLTKPA